MQRCVASIPVWAAIWVLGAVPVSAQPNYVAGDLITFTDTAAAPNGVWSWFQDERAIIDQSDPNNVKLLISSVSAAPSGTAEAGDVDLHWMNINTGAKGTYELHDRLELDDHDSAALYTRPDGRYLAMYSKHGGDRYTRWRISTNAGDPTSWGPEQTFTTGPWPTYNNVHHLDSDRGGLGRTYNFTRTTNYDPNIQVSYDHGTTWSYGGKLLTEGGGGDRPYVKYASDGTKIHFIATNRHPTDYGGATNVYHGYVQDGVLFNSNGVIRDSNVLDSGGVPPAALTPVFLAGTQVDGTPLTKSWTIDLELDPAGHPVGIVSTRANNSNQDHRFLYTRFDGTNWQVNELAKAGGWITNVYRYSNTDYTGLVAIDPDDVNVVYMSSDINPITGAGTSKYEIYKGMTSDLGANWTWEAITADSTVDNIRPIVPEWDEDHTAVIWLRGNYSHWKGNAWDTEVVGLVTIPEPSTLGLASVGACWLLKRRKTS